MDHQQEETRKRTSKVLSAATAVAPEPAAEGTADDAEGRDGSTTMERPRRASRVLSHIKDGFRRSGSSRSIAVRPTVNARNSSMQGSTSAIAEQEDTAAEQTYGIGHSPDKGNSRQDKKRRRIGDYAGPSDSGSSTDVSASTSQILVPPQQETTSILPSPKVPTSTPPLLSPPVVPLTTSDPLLDDRLRSLEAIRSVLGDEVARRLPSVESLRTLSERQRAIQREGEGEVDAEGIELPESTVELLGELDRETAAEESITDATTNQESTASIHHSSLSTQQRERRDRRSSIRNFTNRLGGWLGVGQGRNEGGVDEAAGGVMDVDAAEGTNEVPPVEQEAAAEPTAPQEAALTPPTRLAQGAVMIVQGFVQTTVPPRERRRSRPTPTSSNTNPPPTASRLGMRRTMSQPGPSSTSSSLSPSSLSNVIRSPPPSSIRSRHSSGPTSVMEPSRPLGRAGSAMPHDTARWNEMMVDEEAVASRDRPPRGVNRPGTPVAPEVRAASSVPVPTDRADGHGRGSLRDRGGPRDQPGTAERRGAEREGRAEPPSFAEQARMLGGLLSVATAATATSLLSQGTQSTTSETSTPAAPPRTSGPRAALEALRNRLRSSSRSASTEAEAPVPDRGVEDVLREYMRHAMANSRNASRTAGDGVPPVPMLSTILPTTDPESFEAFLNDMQTSLIQALSAFAGEPEEEEERSNSSVIPDADATSIQPTETPMGGEQEIEEQTTAEQAPDPTAREAAEPRRLNFFRIFQFPARPNPPAQPSDPAVDLIPVVIVGVRSMTRDINTVTAENVAAAPFPFNHTDNIQGAPPEAGSTGATEGVAGVPSESPALDVAEEQPPPEAPAGSWSSRALRSINRLRRPRATRTTTGESEADEEFTRNYVLWVVGGNYPAGHPILTMPHLFTGELSHEDLWTLAEALGQVKPPVASRADIENSGLAVIKASQVKDEGASGAILAICVEQCLICLAEYEDEAESDVRVMKCKHAFHQSCIDEWMVVGRNSCPACRQTGVETANTRDTQPVATEASTSTPNEDVNMAA